MVNVDYEHMRFNDMIVQRDATLGDLIDDPLKLGTVNDSFDLHTTPERLKEATDFANKEVKDILVEDIEKVIEHDKNLGKKDPFKDTTIEDMFTELGI